MNRFLSDFTVATTGWQAFERLVARLLRAEGFDHVSVVGGSGDGGADVLATKNDKRWLFQIKRWSTPISADVVDRTIAAARTYDAEIPVIVSKSGFTADIYGLRSKLAADGLNLQLWDRDVIMRRVARLPEQSLSQRQPELFRMRDYQTLAVENIVGAWVDNRSGSALVVLATGLGKTFVAAEVVRRLSALKPSLRVLVLAHTNDLLYQLDRSFWPFLRVDQATAIVNGDERPDWSDLKHFAVVLASKDTFLSAAEERVQLPLFDVVIVDECHHMGSDTYDKVLDYIGAGAAGGPFLLGLTATPWRPDGEGLDHAFDAPIISIDLVEGLRRGFLANVDYRMYTDNVDWDALRELNGDRFTPKAINRTLFISQWDDAVIERVRDAWTELEGNGRGIVFCGTVEHAEKMATGINAMGFTAARPIYSRSSSGQAMGPIERNRLLWDFSAGRVGILCAVDVLNEGVDVPDVNLVVFQRVTHSRRIFVQQLGRGLRLAPEKKRVLVLDFVSDVRRFAAGLDLKRGLDASGPRPGQPRRVSLSTKISFKRANDEDVEGANFLREWLGDLRELEDAGEDVSIMRYPSPDLVPPRKGSHG